MGPHEAIDQSRRNRVDARLRWPRSARKAKVHAVLLATMLWVALIIMFAVGAGNRSIAGPIKGADFVQFYTLGSLVRTGQFAALYDINALHRAQVTLVPESDPELYPPVYPPQAAIVFAPFSTLSYRYATLLWSAITIVVFWIIVRSAWRPVAATLPDLVFVGAAAAAFPPFWSVVLFGQVTILILLAFWAGWLALERQKRFLAGFAFGLLLLKPQFALPLAAIVLACREWAMLLGALTSIAVQLGVVLAVLGRQVLAAHLAFIPVTLRYADLLEAKPYQSHSLRALTRLAPAALALPLWVILSAAVLVYVVKVWKSSAPLRVRVGVMMLASVLVNPHVIVYDAAVLAMPLIWFGAHVQNRRPGPDAVTFWTIVYWLFVTTLTPTARMIGVQVSVLLMTALFVLIARMALRNEGNEQAAESSAMTIPTRPVSEPA